MNELLRTPVTALLFFLILGTLVVVHELGHFITARLAGVRVLEFGIGFPPRARVLRSNGETLYTLNWLPIGGFVKLEGEDGDDSSDPRSFANARLPVKLVILAAGVLMNLLAALVIFALIALLATPLVGLKIPIVEEGSPAQQAGLQPGDAITTIDGRSFEFFGETTILDGLRGNAGRAVKLGIDHPDGRHDEVTVTLRNPQDVAAGKGALGIKQTEENPFEPYYYGPYIGHDPVTALRIGTEDTFRWFGLIITGLRDLAAGVVSNPTAPPPVQGPVGIAVSIGKIFFGSGPILTLYVAGILSANLALVNALPFPPLDGGRMLVIVLKRILGTRISVRAERLTYFVGFAFLMAFLLWVTYFDVFGRAAQ
jgi:regulator of sigma E protease